MYLLPSVAMQPFVARWYAWPYLIAPGSAAMVMVGRNLKLLRSFVQAPRIHERAAFDSAMAGGSFVRIAASRVSEVEALLSQTLQDNPQWGAFAEALGQLRAILESHPAGDSLEPLYPALPESLRGLVELVYDGYQRPSYRFLEGLLYRSEFYREQEQGVLLRRLDGDDRPFILSTPLLDEPSTIEVSLPFRSDAYEALARARLEPVEIASLAERLCIAPGDLAKFESLFTHVAPPRAKAVEDDSVRVRYFGHAAVLIKSRQVNILIDPLLTYDVGATDGRLTIADLPERIHFVLITHGHGDHLMIEWLLQLRDRIDQIVVPRASGGSLVDPNLKLLLNAIGFGNVTEMAGLDQIELPGDGVITALPSIGEHACLDIQSKLGYSVRLPQCHLAFLADAKNVEPNLYRRLLEGIGRVDTAFIGMECEGAPMSWLYGPLLDVAPTTTQDRARRLSGSDDVEAAELIALLGCRSAYVYAMGMEPWLRFITNMPYTEESVPLIAARRFVADCHKRGIESDILQVSREMIFQ